MLALLRVHLGLGAEPQPPAPWDLDGGEHSLSLALNM